MGDKRLGRLPRTRRWTQVVELLRATPEETGRVSAAVVQAADHEFRQLADDSSFGFTFWLLARITWAARSEDFVGDLNHLGIEASDNSSAIDLISAVSDRVRHELADSTGAGHFGEFAALALRSALASTVGREGPGLFASAAEDVQRAFRTYSTESRFGELARRFLANFMSRSLQSFVDRELANVTGPNSRLTSAGDRTEFLEALDTHTWQASLIVERFAAEWYSKNNWQTRGDISRDQAQRFIAYGLRKLRTELKQGTR